MQHRGDRKEEDLGDEAVRLAGTSRTSAGGKELLAKLKKVMTAIDEAASKAGMGQVAEVDARTTRATES